MIGWLIVEIVFLLVTIFGMVAISSFANYEDWPIFPIVFGGVITIAVGIILIITPLKVKQEINTFNRYQELVDTVYNNGDITDTATNLKLIEMNEWLAGSRADEEVFGIFSFYRGKLDDLEYIKIEVEENE